MVDIVSIITTVISVVASVASLAYWLGRRFAEIEFRFTELENRFNSIEDRLSKLEERVSELENRISRLENRLGKLEERVDGIEGRLARLENAFVQFSDVLIATFESKNMLTQTEAMTLRGLVRALMPIPRTKYYTWKVYERLKQLLDKDPNDYTMADIEELFQIADLIEKEGMETNRKELLEYAWKLRYYAMVARAVFIYPKLRQQQK
ncbi:hypothetical protein [Vulcanisaeta sp. JCM 14467]|uniref:hypothetical protein n=1 Tax=Vulcanisaeta sp. JCM 14467 TaxID=1295370 RepID=UPI0006D1D66B|nr:hypothetical protein [Vulcanisaeta sp. JCM 14467]